MKNNVVLWAFIIIIIGTVVLVKRSKNDVHNNQAITSEVNHGDVPSLNHVKPANKRSLTASHAIVGSYFNRLSFGYAVTPGSVVTASESSVNSTSVTHTRQKFSTFILSDSSEYVSSRTESVQVIFISDNMANQLISCVENQNKLFNCHSAMSNLAGPEDVLIVANKLYISNMNSSNITICNITSHGVLSSCNNQHIPLASPVHLYYNTQQLLISDFGVKHTVSCTLDDSGNLVKCENISNIAPQLFTTSTYNGYNYSPNYTDRAINKCINEYNNSTCGLIKDSTIILPLTVLAFNHQAYIVNAINEAEYNVLQCSIDTNGDFSGCHMISNELKFPIGIAGFVTSH